MSSQAALSRPPRTGIDTTPTQNSPEQGGAASSLSVSRLAAGLALRPCSSCACSRDPRSLPHLDWPRSPLGLRAGPGSWQSQPSAPLLPLSWSSRPLPSSEKAQSPSCELLAEARWDAA